MQISPAKGVTEIPATPFAFIWFALKPYQKRFWWAFLIVCIVQTIAVGQSFALKGFVDSAQSYANGLGPSLTIVFLWMLAFPILNFLYALGYRTSGFLMNVVTISTRSFAIKSLFDYLSLHSLSYFNNRFS